MTKTTATPKIRLDDSLDFRLGRRHTHPTGGERGHPPSIVHPIRGGAAENSQGKPVCVEREGRRCRCEAVRIGDLW